uniref:Uncharacterized protein n=1 Tax=Kalmanozyma brasiliensis (strain GHG001) TaxID=1365824 RepID=V5EAQ6_KALBG
MDAPEYVWKSIEKGKTLQAAWAFLLTRATWLDLIESRSQSALAKDGEAGISSVAQAVSLLKVNVKKAFPFIEKQWQTMLPMRKQIVARAAVTHIHTELQRLEEAIDAILQERLLELAEGKLSVAVQELLRRTKESVVAIAAVQVASPLDDLFKPIDAELASNNTLQAHVTGRSNQVDNLARLYEDPLATLTADLEVYMAELGERPLPVR